MMTNTLLVCFVNKFKKMEIENKNMEYGKNMEYF